MLKNPRSRGLIAILGILLGLFFTAGVVWSVLTGQAEWWSLILVLPALVIVLRLFTFWSRQRH